MGDYNINLLNYENHQHTSDFIDQLHSNSFISLINKPTRVKTQSATLIDDIFTNSLSDMEHTIQGIIYSDISDNFPIIHINYSFQAANLVSEIVVRNLSQRNKQAFCRAVSEVDWGPLYISGNAQESFTWFHSTLSRLYNKHFPKQIMNKKYNTRKMWLTELLKNAIKTKNKLYLKSLKIDTAANEIQYKKYRNKLNHILRCAERKHFQDILEKNEHNIKKTWQIFKSIVNRNKKSQVHSKSKLKDDTFTTDKSVISCKFNDFFVNIGPNLAKKIPPQSVSHLKLMDHPAINSIFFQMLPLMKWKLLSYLSKTELLAGMISLHKYSRWFIILLIIHWFTWVIYHFSKVYFQRCLELQMFFPCLKRVTFVFSTTIVQCLIYIYYQRFMKRSCIIAY